MRVIHWFRQDLRLSDNPSLNHAAESGTVIPVYIYDDSLKGQQAIGEASCSWLHHSLISLNKSLKNRLQVFRGDPLDVLQSIVEQQGVSKICWNRCYEPWCISQDEKLTAAFQSQGIDTQTFNASLLWEPWQVLKADGTPYKVFTPYYQRGCLNAEPVDFPLPVTENLSIATKPAHVGSIDSLALLPGIRWDRPLFKHWQVGEQAAHLVLDEFVAQGLSNYKSGRDFPSQPHVSRLSPYLHWGEISPRQVWHRIRSCGDDANVEAFLRQLGWREFAVYLLYHFPHIVDSNLQKKFDAFPWKRKNRKLKLWQQGQTGYPIVDAGMRELWQTGHMHNRVRMIVGSFLVKNLLLHWRHGQAWFHDCLFDADTANNSAGWQWVAGCGVDAAPYFRVFNPVSQGEKFDSHGVYTRQFVPELEKLPSRYLFSPWTAPAEVLEQAGIELGRDYPHPIVDLRISREEALAAFRSLANYK